MKKTKQIDTYYCDYCGKECEHTPEYILPNLEEKSLNACSPREGRMIMSFSYNEIHPNQKDICPECQKKIVSLLKLTNAVDLEDKHGNVTLTFSAEYKHV